MSIDSLLHITDLHFWKVVINPLELLNKRFLGNLNVWLRRRREFLFADAESYADALASLEIPRIVATGDFTSTATEDECAMGAAFARRLEALDLQLFVLPGNHDLYTFESVRRRRFARHFGPWLPRDGFPALKELPGGTPLLLVPTTCPNLLSSRGRITDGEVNATVGLLDDGSSAVIVAGHYPLLHKTHAYKAARSRQLRNGEALRRALGELNRPILYVSGHVHRFSYVQDADFPDLTHLSTGAFFRTDPSAGVRGEFSEIHVGESDFTVIRHTLRGEWTSEEESKRG